MPDKALRSKITQLIPEKPSFKFQDKYDSVTLEFDSRHLFEHRQNRFSSKSSVWLLHDLSPLLTPQCTIANSIRHNLSLAIFLTLSAIVVWFSTLTISLPLLAPILSLAALSFYGLCVNGLRKRFWACINDDDGIRVTQISIVSTETTQQTCNRELFENKLSEAIEAAKQQEYYNFD